MKTRSNTERQAYTLAEIHKALVKAQAAFDQNNRDDLEECLMTAGFALCHLLPDELVESSPDIWFS